MKADISAYTFRPTKHFAAVVVGQGQVLVDSAINEQEEIARHRTGVTTADLVGASGAPKSGGGFAISVAPDGKDLLLSPGRLYVGGILCENAPPWVGATVVSSTVVTVDSARPPGASAFSPGQWLTVQAGGSTSQVKVGAVSGRSVTLNAAPAGMPAAGGRIQVAPITSLRWQPDRFTFDPFDPSDPEQVTPGAYRVELDVWHRHISPVEDPSIRDIALGDADAATRLRVVWQLRLVSAGPIGGGACDSGPAPAPGRLIASTVPGLPSDGPCVLPDEAGFRGLENQLYRIEVHSSSSTELRLRWQRDNACIASRIEALGAKLTVEDMGRDDQKGFATARLVEVTDDALELEQLESDLIAVSLADAATRTITLASAPTAAQLSRGARARRWDGEIVIDLTSAPPGQPVPLERGLQVGLLPGALRPGDYWLIPARTSNSAGGGTIDWPTDDDGQFLALPPFGIEHRLSSLALVDTDGNAFLNGPTNVRSCRSTFPPLTAITASDVSVDPTTCGFTGVANVQQAIDSLCLFRTGPCTVIATPGTGWERVFDAIADGRDAEVCFPVGDYPVAKPVKVVGKGNLVLHGAGLGARLFSTGSEAVLIFDRCGSVTVHSLNVRGAATTSPEKGLLGAVTFVDCADVEVRECRLACAPRETRQSTCLRATRCRLTVRDTLFEVGHQQVGLLAVDAPETIVSGNRFIVPPLITLPFLVTATPLEQQHTRRLLFSDLSTARGGGTRVAVKIGQQDMSFATTPGGTTTWPTLLQTSYPSMRHFQNDVDRVFRGIFSGHAITAALPLLNFFKNRIIQRRVAVMAQAIVVAGTDVGPVRVDANRIDDAIQGIHVGASGAGRPRSGPPFVAGATTISGNTINILVPPEGARARHAIFVGNVDRLRVIGNDMRYESRAEGDKLKTDGLRVYGFIGQAMTIRDNVLESFPGGMMLTLLTEFFLEVPPPRMWAVEDNLILGASPQIRIFGPLASRVMLRGNQPGPPDNHP
jgi:hypothetical protein